MLLLLTTIDKEECQTVNTQKDDNYHKISHTTESRPRPRTTFKAKDLDAKAKDLDFCLKDQGQGLTSLHNDWKTRDSSD